MSARYVDVAIIGGGLAGNLLARQLRRTLPDLSIAVFEKSHATSYKVGESTVELASHYLIRRLGLSGYLYENHLPKNGLRFFFDTPKRDAVIQQMSEIGSTALPFHPSFQIDRLRIEADLLRMNQEDGVFVSVESPVHDVSLAGAGRSSDGHRFVVTQGGMLHAYSCRWLVDASGRSSVLAKQLGLRVLERGHQLGAVWGRFRQVSDIDTVDQNGFRARVRYTSRMLSTTHFCYPGYWIWFIPLGRGITSVGVVMDRACAWTASLRKPEGFLSFLRSHSAVGSLISSAELIDIGSYEQLAYGTRQYFSEARWGLTGEAAAFSDPFYSPGSDFIALENDFLTDLIWRDVRGADNGQFKDRVSMYNRYLAFRFEATMRLYRKQYGVLGSFELLKLKWQLDIALYYHLWVAQYMQDQHLEETFLNRQMAEQEGVLNALSNFADLFLKVEHALRSRGTYYRSNCGRFSHALEGIDWVEEVGQPQALHQQFKRLGEILNRIRGAALDLLEESALPVPTRTVLPLSRFLTQDPLV